MTGKLRNMTAIYISRGREMLLLYRVGSRVIAPSFVGIGGHFEPDELNDARACVLREMREEIGLTQDEIENLSMRYAMQRLKNGEIRQNYYFFADLKDGAEIDLATCEGRAQWIDESEILKKEMPVTAKYMLKHYLTVGRYTSCLYAGATTENGAVFTELCEF